MLIFSSGIFTNTYKKHIIFSYNPTLIVSQFHSIYLIYNLFHMDEFPSHHFDATVKFNKKSTCAISLSHERSFNFLSRSITTRCSSVTNRELLHDCYQSIVYWLPLAPLFVVWFALQYRVRLYVQLRIPEARKNIIS